MEIYYIMRNLLYHLTAKSASSASERLIFTTPGTVTPALITNISPFHRSHGTNDEIVVLNGRQQWLLRNMLGRRGRRPRRTVAATSWIYGWVRMPDTASSAIGKCPCCAFLVKTGIK